MDPDSICLCGHKNNSHSDAGCQFSECSCKKWREDKSQNFDDYNKRDTKTSTRKLAERFEKMTMHKNLMRRENDQLKNTKTSTSSKISKIEKFDLEEKQREELIKLNEKKEWEKINEHLEMKLKIDHENVNVWIDKGNNYVNWGKDDDAIYCFKNALMFESNQDNTFDNKKHQILFDLGEIYSDKKEYSEAIKYLEDSLKIKPDYLKSLRQLGFIYVQKDDYKKAKELFNKVLDYQSNDIYALDSLGWIHEDNKEYDEAIKIFNKVRQLKDDNDTDTYAEVHEANCYYEKNNLEHAELLINKEKIIKNPTQYSYEVRGNICKDLKKFDEAIKNYEKEFGWINVRNNIWFDLGYCNQLIGNNKLSIEYYLKRLEYSELTEGIAQNLGDAYESIGQFENSLKWYNLGLEKYPDSENILYNKGILCERNEKSEDAMKCYGQILKKDPQNLDVMRRTTYCLERLGDYHNSIKLTEKILEIITQNNLNPAKTKQDDLTEESLLNSIGWDWIQIGEYQKGLDFIDQALAINPKKAYIIDSKAVALKKLGRFKEAKEWFEKLFEIEKRDSQKIEIGICHRKMGNGLDADGKEKHNIESIKIFDSILEKDNSNSNAWYEKSLCYWNLKQYDEGKNCMVKAIEINPHKKEYWLELGDISFAQKKPIQAIMYFDKSIKIEESSDAYHMKARALSDVRMYDDAIDCYDKALDMFDEDKSIFPFAFDVKPVTKLWEEKGTAYFDKENYSVAIDCYDKALDLEPEYNVALMNKGNALRILKKYPDAITCLDDAIKSDSNNYYPQHRKTLTIIEMKRYSDAIELAEKLLEQFPEKSEQTIKLLIRIYEETEEKSKQKDYEKKLQEIIDLKNNKTDGV